MIQVETRNARIVRTFLGFEDHGIFVANLTLDYGRGSQQGFTLQLHSKSVNVHNVLGSLLRTLHVESWEELTGVYCRARNGTDGRIQLIGHITEDVWFGRESAGEA